QTACRTEVRQAVCEAANRRMARRAVRHQERNFLLAVTKNPRLRLIRSKDEPASGTVTGGLAELRTSAPETIWMFCPLMTSPITRPGDRLMFALGARMIPCTSLPLPPPEKATAVVPVMLNSTSDSDKPDARRMSEECMTSPPEMLNTYEPPAAKFNTAAFGRLSVLKL